MKGRKNAALEFLSPRVVIDPDADPAGVGTKVVHAARNCLAEFIILEGVHSHGLWPALGMPLPPGILEVPHQLFLLRVHGDHGLSASLELTGAPRGERRPGRARRDNAL